MSRHGQSLVGAERAHRFTVADVKHGDTLNFVFTAPQVASQTTDLLISDNANRAPMEVLKLYKNLKRQEQV